MLKIIILSLIICVDFFGIGITFGTAEIKITNSDKIVLYIVTFIISFISVFLGIFIFSYIPYQSVKTVSTLLLIVPGLLLIKESLLYSLNQKFLDIKISFLLLFDNIPIIMSFAFDIKNIFYMPFFIILFQIILINIGINSGNKMKNIHSESFEKWIFISGFLFIMMGIANIF